MKSIFTSFVVLVSVFFMINSSFAQLIGQGTEYDKNGNSLFNYVVEATKCYESYDVAIKIQPIENGNSDLKIEWENGESSFYRDNLPYGQYNAIITINETKKISYAFSISSPDAIRTDIFEVKKNGVRNLDLQVLGGSRPYSFQWNTGDTLEDITNIGPGIYEVIITDTNKCSHTVTTEILVEEISFKSADLEDKVDIFPNPSKGYITILVHSDVSSIIIYDLFGKQINGYFNILLGMSLNIENLLIGTYTVKMYFYDGTIETKKLIVD